MARTENSGIKANAFYLQTMKSFLFNRISSVRAWHEKTWPKTLAKLCLGNVHKIFTQKRTNKRVQFMSVAFAINRNWIVRNERKSWIKLNQHTNTNNSYPCSNTRIYLPCEQYAMSVCFSIRIHLCFSRLLFPNNRRRFIQNNSIVNIVRSLLGQLPCVRVCWTSSNACK